ncbi:hypothetical protein Dimus_018575 [Dionaea muscipula]
MPKHYRPPGKKKEGNASKYMTRTQAVRQIGITLPGFRRLCILKGLHPREPKKKFKGTHQTYYHTKDILFLRREPLVEKFREQKIHERKVKKALSKKNKDLAQRLLTHKPGYSLDRLILERYPRFIDALGDLDDCLSMVHLFAALPALDSEKIGVDRVHSCRRLSHEWQAYISRTHKLRKTFVSVKGIYYQAEVEGQKITWITPHALQQVIVDDVDFGVMLIFLEFYEALLGFINFKLYHSINVEYPPILDPRLEALAADLYALSRWLTAKSGPRPLEVNSSESDQNKPEMVDGQLDESEVRLAQLHHQLPSNEPGALVNLLGNVNDEDEDDEETKECKTLFKNLKFFLSREVPRESLLFIIPAFGGSVSWEGEGGPFEETDESITHQIIDRPTQGRKLFCREYVQPQWVYDCVNACIILPTADYLVGRIPPPHLSPFVDNEAEGYVPDYADRIKQLQAAARKQILPMPGVGKEDMDDPQNLLVEGIISRREANEVAERKQKMQALEKQYHEELKMESQGREYAPTSTSKQSCVPDAKTVDEPPPPDSAESPEEIMAKTTMSRKDRGLYEAIQISKKRKQHAVELLKSRKKKHLQGQKSGKD